MLVELSDIEIAKLDPYEGFPTWYNRHDFEFTIFKKQEDGSMKESQVTG